MQNLKLGTAVRFLPLGLALSLVLAACGGSDTSNGNKNTGGSTATSTGGTTSTGATTSTGKAGGTSTGKAGSTGNAGSTSTGTAGSTGTGGSTGTSGGDFMTGLPPDKPLSSLTDAEAMQVCSAVQTYFADSEKDLQCRLAGFVAALGGANTDAAAQAACKAAYDTCAGAPAMPTTGNCMKPGGTCTATVGELEACANDTKGVFAQVDMAIPSCATLKLSDLMSVGAGLTPPMEPASCTALDMKCPNSPMPPSMMMP